MSNRISIITAVYNRASTIASAIETVLSQQDVDIEYIIVDGNSTDGTRDVVLQYQDRIAKYICESDSGIYDALNKGIRASTGDIVGFLHADDLLAGPHVIRQVADVFKDSTIEAAYGDLTYVTADRPEHIVRYWKSKAFRLNRFRWGWMPPHPTVYLRREKYLELGGYRDDFQISADYELLVRMMFKHRLKTAYIEDVLVKMRLGGKSNASMGNRLLANREDSLAWTVNGLYPPIGLQLLKPLRKLRQYWTRPPRKSVQPG